MENFKSEYTGLELLQLLDLLERDRFPSSDLAAAAEKRDLQQKEICWIVERPYNERRAENEGKERDEAEEGRGAQQTAGRAETRDSAGQGAD